MQVYWNKCEGEIWCELNKLNLEHNLIKSKSGVYIIWCGTSERKVIFVGSGGFAEEFGKCRKDIAIQAFVNHGLYVSWAEVSILNRAAVESFLNKILSPKIATKKGEKSVKEVNLPW